jgi:hypothetical protein
MRGKRLDLNSIKYDAIREYFEKNENETVTSFSQKIYATEWSCGDRSSLVRKFIKGEQESFFTIKQIKRMCEIVGKPFEEVFKECETE